MPCARAHTPHHGPVFVVGPVGGTAVALKYYGLSVAQEAGCCYGCGCAGQGLGGVQILCLGVMGEYLGRLYQEMKARPRYIIEKKI